MKLTFFGATKRVTGSNFLLEVGGKKILVDCGLFQGDRDAEKKNFEPFGYDPKTIDAVAVTHSHIDHIGRIPKLTKEGFTGTIYSTKPCKAFARVFLEDTGKIMQNHAKREGLPPIWEKEDLLLAMKQWEGIDYHKPVTIGGVTIELIDAGHILGSAIVIIRGEGKSIAFSGDLGNPPVPLLNHFDVPENINYVVAESTYGDRLHEMGEERKLKLERVLEDIHARNGVLLIPTFAMERTQELLYEINELVENHRIPKIPVFVDSPLAIKATRVFNQFERYFNKEATHHINAGDDIFNFPGLTLTEKPSDSRAIANTPTPKVIIAGSGMSNGGRIREHEKQYLEKDSTIMLFIGFQVRGTLGRAIKDGEKMVEIDGREVKINAEMREIPGYSAHADQRKMLEWLGSIKKKSPQLTKVFFTHGEEGPAMTLAGLAEKEFGVAAVVPKEGESMVL